jgi:hypothetical protein
VPHRECTTQLLERVQAFVAQLPQE